MSRRRSSAIRSRRSFTPSCTDPAARSWPGCSARCPIPRARGRCARLRSPAGFRGWRGRASASHRDVRGGGDAGRADGLSPLRRAAGVPDRALGRPRAARAREGRGDPGADADRPRRAGCRVPAPAGGRGARRGPRPRARRTRVRPGGGCLPGRRCRARSSRSTAHASAWEETLAREPRPPLLLEGEALDRGLAAMGSFADLISPYLAGHSAGVAELAARRRGAAGSTTAGVAALRRAALVHDLGRVAVDARVWQKPGPLTADELGAGEASPVPHRARALAFGVPLRARAGRRRAPRAPRRVRLSPRRHPARSWRFPHGCWRPPTPTTR